MTLKFPGVQRLDSSFLFKSLGDDDEAADRLVVLVARGRSFQSEKLEAGLRDCAAHIFRCMGIAQAFAEPHAAAVMSLECEGEHATTDEHAPGLNEHRR